MNKKYIAIGLAAVLLAGGGVAYYKKTHEASINVLGTTDIHGATSRAMIKYVEDKKKKWWRRFGCGLWRFLGIRNL